MDATKWPDLRGLSLTDAKALILRSLTKGGSYDFHLDSFIERAVEAEAQKMEAQLVARGSTTRTYYGSMDQHPAAQLTGVLYDALWELVQEGILRPGPRVFEKLNPYADGYSLTPKGRVSLGTD